jgi:hypothetical protein
MAEKDRSKRRAKCYNKHVVQRTVGGRDVEKDENGLPVLGKLVKSNIIITPEMAETLNFGWDSSEKPLSYYYVEVKEEANQEFKGEISEELEFDRDALKAEADGLGIEYKKNIKTKDLAERIANHKAE